VYRDRIQRGREAFAARRLRALGPLLTALSQFFKGTWEKPLDELPDEDKLYVFFQSSGILMDTLGYAVPEVRASVEAGLRLCRRYPDSPYLVPMVYRLWKMHFSPTQLSAARESLGELRALAAGGTPAARLAALRASGSTAFLLGDFAGAVAAGEGAADLYRSVPAADWDREEYFDVGELVVCSQAYLSVGLCLRGLPDQAVRRSAASVELARERFGPHTLALALSFDAWLLELTRDVARVRERADETVRLSAEYGYNFQLGAGLGIQGWATAAAGDFRLGVELMLRGLFTYIQAGSRLYRPYWLGQIARSQMSLRNLDEAEKLIRQAKDEAVDSGEVWWDPDLLILEADLLRARGGNPSEVRGLLARALEVARRQESLWQELHAAVELVRLPAPTATQRDADRTALRAVYDRFTEGHELTDLKEARVLLDPA
jgi:predicted ATPase